MSSKKQPERKPKKKKAAVKRAPKKAAKARPKKAAANKSVIKSAAPAELNNSDDLFNSLPLKQRNFIVNYVENGGNGTNAAKEAGFSARTADSQASRLLKNDKVKRLISERVGRHLAKKEISTDRTLDELRKMAYFDPRKFWRSDGTLVPVHELDEECGAALAGFNATLLFADKAPIGELRKIKFADKRAALDMLMRFHGLYKDKTEHTVKIERVVVREAVKEPRKLPPAKPDF